MHKKATLLFWSLFCALTACRIQMIDFRWCSCLRHPEAESCQSKPGPDQTTRLRSLEKMDQDPLSDRRANCKIFWQQIRDFIPVSKAKLLINPSIDHKLCSGSDAHLCKSFGNRGYTYAHHDVYFPDKQVNSRWDCGAGIHLCVLYQVIKSIKKCLAAIPQS